MDAATAHDDIDLTVSIVSYNTVEVLEECLRALVRASTGLRVETYVVDNGSSDGSADMVSQTFPAVQLIRNAENRFFTRAHNQALARARGRHVLILNSDVLVAEDTLRRTFDFMESHPGVGAAGCLSTYPDGSLTEYGFRGDATVRDMVVGRTPLHYIWPGASAAYHKADTAPTAVVPVEVVPDLFLWARRSVLEQVGLYDEHLLLYWTENDLCLRIRQAGWQVYHLGNISVVHFKAQSTHKLRPTTVLKIERDDCVHYFRKHHGAALALLVKIAVDINILGLVIKNKRYDGGRFRPRP